MIDALAKSEPVWEPGTAHGYHAVTYGYLVGEVVRRVTGRTLGTYFADEVAGPLGLEFWIGLPEEHEDRTAPMIGSLAPGEGEIDESMRALLEQFIGPDSFLGRALTANGAFAGPDTWNRRDVHAAEVPAANGITNARSLARMYAALVGAVNGDGPAAGPLLTREQVDAARLTQTSGADKVLFFDTTFGLGFMTSSPFAPYGGAGSFGHAGAGGSVGFADPENQLGFGYVMNRMLQNLSGDPRTRRLIGAAYNAIGAPSPYV
jgi:CubicO group peptidase (beta-lactamase class C family)